jgi:hypothetical protein
MGQANKPTRACARRISPWVKIIAWGMWEQFKFAVVFLVIASAIFIAASLVVHGNIRW